MSKAPSLNSTERHISNSLALIFSLRMLGLFIVLPIFVPYAHTINGGDNALWVGLAMGAYGLTQAFLYIPYGIASDHFGRKIIIIIGLIIFAMGSIWAACATDIYNLTGARALQGAGAISSVLVAMVTDNTRTETRTRAMAKIGMSIALTFALSLIIAPLLFNAIGMQGIFITMTVCALLSIILIVLLPHKQATTIPIGNQTRLGLVLRDKQQWYLNFGVFVLHAVQMAIWVVIPLNLNRMNISATNSTWLYASVIILSMAFMLPLIIQAEKYQKSHRVISLSILLIIIALFLLALNWDSLWILSIALLLFFTGFNVLEATQPSLLSKHTTANTRGAAAGVYNTIQALGLFCGAFIGAILNTHFGATTLFLAVLTITIIWLISHTQNKVMR